MIQETINEGLRALYEPNSGFGHEASSMSPNACIHNRIHFCRKPTRRT